MHSNLHRAPIVACTLLLASALGACASGDREIWDAIEARNAADGARGGPPGPAVVGDDASRPPIAIPTSAIASVSLRPLQFLAGRWVAVNPNGTMNEEIWTPPRGNVAIGTFRQVRRDSDCAFVEVSQIAVEGDEIVLRLRHLHGRLEVPEGRAEVSLFRLVSLDDRRVEFTGTEAAAGVTSVVYERTGERELIQSIGFSAESGEKPFVTRYALDVD